MHRNLDWHMSPREVGEHLYRFLSTVLVQPADSDLGDKDVKCIASLGMEEIEVVLFEAGKKKARDADKLHQGYALVRFERAAIVEVACKALAG